MEAYNAVEVVAKLRYAQQIQREVGKHLVRVSIDKDGNSHIDSSSGSVEVTDYYGTKSKVKRILENK